QLVAQYPQHDAGSAGAAVAALAPGEKFGVAGGRVFCPLPFATNYAAQATRTVPFTHPDSVKLQVLAKFLTPNYLHREIRERNGAYGGGAAYAAQQGVFSFFSYRDPSPLQTIGTFARSIDWFLAHTVEDRELREAKLSVFGDLDAPLSVADEGMAYFTTGITDDVRQERRDRFFAVSAADLKDVAQKYLAAPAAAEQTALAVIGEEGLDMTGEWKRVQLQ
ncbi:Mitochondrial presequence protease, partial [Coemansia spiralis]